MNIIDLKKEQFANIIEGSKPVLIDFWAPWCGYCRRIGPALEKIAGERDDIIVAKINIDEEPDLAASAGIEVIPTLVLYKDGSSISSVTGPGSKAAIDQFIDSNLK
ncbi:MAG TPA: thioredoxin [Candidatus Fimisoma avicola]|uniref:Thioredoxin n=1 Tax=Candidatus Fimisoma avicola TaxID=2840826 RepID=A0A9D1I5H9_9FIRM|nr:thioredoxin [Candidatus Fimisoma avicola]